MNSPITTIRLLALCIAFFGTSVANSATISTTGSFDEVFNSTDYYDGNGTYLNIDVQRSDIVGLQQFDPALGTLTGVTLTTDFGVSVYGEVHAAESLHTPVAHSAEFYATDGYTPGVSTVVGYNTTPTSTVSLAYAMTNVIPSCTGIEDVDGYPCVGYDSDSFTYADQSSVVGNTLDQIGLSNILGTGALTGLTVGSYQPDGSSIFDVVNVLPDETYGFIETTIGAGSVTLTYEYSPVPVPAAVWLFASGIGGLLGFAKRKAA